MAATNWVDHYHTLGLYDPINKTGKGPESTPEEIKAAWKLQLSAWHPDKFRGDAKRNAEERTKSINAAYDVLRDPKQKAAYDKEWHKKNPWFKNQGADDTASAELPEIAVRWEPSDALSNLFYDIPKGEKRRAKLHITPRVGKGFLVEIKEPISGWLKIISPKSRRDTVPFTAEIEVDTTNLIHGREYDEELEFVLEDL